MSEVYIAFEKNCYKQVCGKFKMTNLYSFNKGEDS
mgnify:CR=1 FL=1